MNEKLKAYFRPVKDTIYANKQFKYNDSYVITNSYSFIVSKESFDLEMIPEIKMISDMIDKNLDRWLDDGYDKMTVVTRYKDSDYDFDSTLVNKILNICGKSTETKIYYDKDMIPFLYFKNVKRGYYGLLLGRKYY